MTTITVPGNVIGDKVKVQLRGRNYLSLAEVEVFEKSTSNNQTPTTVESMFIRIVPRKDNRMLTCGYHGDENNIPKK